MAETGEAYQDASYDKLSIDFGDIIYEAIEENVHIESEPWAIDRIDRILKRLHAARGKGDEFVVVIPWLEEYTAFTLPGRHIFFTRRLFQLCDNDDMAAMVIAHEMAHHDLGHLDVLPDWARNLNNLDAKYLLLVLYRLIETQAYSQEMESDADLYALELCLKAGFDGSECIRLFQKFEKFVLDLKDVAGAYGLDRFDDERYADPSWDTKFSLWLTQRRRAHPPVRERREMLARHLELISRGVGSHRVSTPTVC